MLPGFLFLHGRYRPARVELYRDQVARAFAPLSPFLVQLSGDPAVFLERAERRSGAGFTDRVLAALRRTPLPAYGPGAVDDAEAMRRFFRWAGDQTRSLLDRWPMPAVALEADVLSPDQLRGAVARALSSTPSA